MKRHLRWPLAAITATLASVALLPASAQAFEFNIGYAAGYAGAGGLLCGSNVSGGTGNGAAEVDAHTNCNSRWFALVNRVHLCSPSSCVDSSATYNQYSPSDPQAFTFNGVEIHATTGELGPSGTWGVIGESYYFSDCCNNAYDLFTAWGANCSHYPAGGGFSAFVYCPGGGSFGVGAAATFRLEHGRISDVRVLHGNAAARLIRALRHRRGYRELPVPRVRAHARP